MGIIYEIMRADWADCDALYVTWEEVEEALGGPHGGDPASDQRLVAALLEVGAPDWIREADGWIDEGGWGLYHRTMPSISTFTGEL